MEPQELYCHNCDRYVQFAIDGNLDGRHIINCPNCKHEHFRVVRDGVITSERWRSSDQNIFNQWAGSDNSSTYGSGNTHTATIYGSTASSVDLGSVNGLRWVSTSSGSSTTWRF